MIISSASTIALLLTAHNTSRPLHIDMVKCELGEKRKILMEKLPLCKPELAVSYILQLHSFIADLSKLFYRDRTLLGRCILLEKMWEGKIVIFSSERLTIKPEDAVVSLVRKLIHSVRFSRAWKHAPVSA